MEINHKGSVGAGRARRAQAGVKRFIQASSCSTYGAGGDEMRTETSDLAPQTAYARCKILVEQGVRALMDDALHPGLHAQRHRLRRQPAAALRPGAQQPLRLRPHHRRDPHDLGRLALAADHPYRGHLPGDALRADGADARRSPARPSTSAPTARTTASARSPRSWPRTFPGCALTVGDSRRRHPQLPRLLRQDPRRTCRSSAPAGPPSAAPASSRAVFERIGLTREMFEAAALHPAEGAEAPARHRPARRAPPLARSAGRLTFADA